MRAVGGWVLVVVAAVLMTVGHGAAIVGIDFGSKFFKVAYVQPGKAFDIVLNANTKRKTANLIGLDTSARLYDSDAAAMSARDPTRLFARSRDFLGTGVDSTLISHLDTSMGIKYELEGTPEDGTFRFVLDKGTEKELKLHPVEVVGMILSSIKRMAGTYIETDVNDCVITVPSFFTQAQREALLHAAEIGGLNVLGLVDENVAAGVQHGVYNEFSNSSHYLLMYNMGAASTKVTLFNFWGKPGPLKKSKPVTQIEVLAKAADETLGGDAFDMVMTNMLISAFETANPGLKVRDSPRAFERVKAQANKVKTVLSANVEIPVSIESLMDGKDLRTLVTREAFEAASKDLLDRVTVPVNEALKAAGLENKDINAVELIGGGIRIPRIKAILGEYFAGHELGSHLNGDEAMAFGSVFIGANMSKAFRVRPVGLTDITTDEVSVTLRETSTDDAENVWSKDAVLFNASNPLDANRVVSFKRESNVECTLIRNTKNGPVQFAHYEVTGVDKALEKFSQYGKPKISLSFKLTHSDTVGLVKADAIFIEEIPAEPGFEEEQEAAAAATADTTASDNADTNADTDAEAKEAASKDAADANGATDEDKKTDEADSEKADAEKTESKSTKTKKPKGPRKKTHKFSLTVVRSDKDISLKALQRATIESAKELLASYDNREEEQRSQEATRNELESFIFSSRDKIRSNEEEVDKVLSEEDKEKLFDDLEALEDWLEDEGENAEVSEIKSRRLAMDTVMKRILRRVEELEQRPATVRAARKLTGTIRQQIENTWGKERPWITKEEIDTIIKTVTDFEAWLLAAEEAQDAIALTEDPVLTASDVVQHLEKVQNILELALRRSPPRPPVKKKAPKKKPVVEDAKDEAKSEGGSDSDGDATAADDTTKVGEEEAASGSEKTPDSDEGDEEKDEL
eukprot:CAMPEP_0184558766 /NCGR_PEP_ID=MMETSP0199_2-20130426/46085_1 /TAXON_ID=1112570 /ORGANISM="Thraustochytrium sp., Strain LLF1b" /LENGTH=917 /DNA_ID=CAMNT_0026956035 /DNA_START=27 /DNA_END=2780 /DNA_ORIENTATION=+